MKILSLSLALAIVQSVQVFAHPISNQLTAEPDCPQARSVVQGHLINIRRVFNNLPSRTEPQRDALTQVESLTQQFSVQGWYPTTPEQTEMWSKHDSLLTDIQRIREANSVPGGVNRILPAVRSLAGDMRVFLEKCQPLAQPTPLLSQNQLCQQARTKANSLILEITRTFHNIEPKMEKDHAYYADDFLGKLRTPLSRVGWFPITSEAELQMWSDLSKLEVNLKQINPQTSYTKTALSEVQSLRPVIKEFIAQCLPVYQTRA